MQPRGNGVYARCQAQLARASTMDYREVENSEPDPKSLQDTWQVINTTTFVASDALTIKNIASYAEFRETSRFLLGGDYFGDPTTGVPPLTSIRVSNTPGYHNSTQSTYTDELQFQGRAVNGSLDWQAGGYFENSDPIGLSSQLTILNSTCPTAYDQIQAGSLAPNAIHCPNGSISVQFRQTWFRNRGLYAQATYHLSDKFALTGGFRYTWDKATGTFDGTSVSFPTPTTNRYICSNGVRIRNPDGSFPVVIGGFGDHSRCSLTFTAKSSRPTWLIDLDYKPTDDVLIYAKWARGYRAGGVAGSNITFETWNPEKVDTYEAGAKASFHGPVRGYFNFAGFYNNFTNQQLQAGLIRNSTTPNNPAAGGIAIVNAGKSRIYGAEIDASATLFNSLQLDLGYTYLNTKLQSIVTPVIPPETLVFYSQIVPNAVAGDRLALSPRNRLTATATYTLPLDKSIGAIALGGTVVYTSSQFLSRAIPDYLRTIPANTLLLLNASWKDVLGAPVDLSFFMTNVTNQKFPLATTTGYGSFSIEAQLPNEPRMFGFRLKYRFGS